MCEITKRKCGLILILILVAEQIGGEIIDELGDQRESLVRTRDRVGITVEAL